MISYVVLIMLDAFLGGWWVNNGLSDRNWIRILTGLIWVTAGIFQAYLMLNGEAV